MSESCGLYVEYLEPPSYWAEDYEPPFMGEPGFYVTSHTGDILSGPHEARAEAEIERQYLIQITAD